MPEITNSSHRSNYLSPNLIILVPFIPIWSVSVQMRVNQHSSAYQTQFSTGFTLFQLSFLLSYWFCLFSYILLNFNIICISKKCLFSLIDSHILFYLSYLFKNMNFFYPRFCNYPIIKLPHIIKVNTNVIFEVK